ncbi:MAG: MFS transporter [Chloroflexi bacterium]|nr:MFS transporter [Chloroflexota bacterium]OJV92192.1 MAG: MFS transporter [Chloroflexi bacterium 54-19]
MLPQVRWALVSLSLATLLPALGTSIASVSLPTLAQTFNASFPQVQWIVLAYLLATTALVVSAGRLGDIFGRRRLLMSGLVVFTAASILCGAAPTLWLLIAARAAQGFGAAVMLSLSMALVGETVPKQKTGSAMGLLGTMSAIGTALGPSLGGILISELSWRSIFLINLPLGGLTFFLAYRYLPVEQGKKAREGERVRFDTLGTLVLALTLAGYALAMTLGGGKFGVLNIAHLVAALFGAGLFVLTEAKATSPLIKLAVFRNPLMSGGFATSTLVTTVLMATLVVGPFYLAYGLGLGSALIGLVMSVGPVVVALTGIPAGRLVDRLGAQRLTILGLVTIMVGAFGLTLIPFGFGIPGYLAPIAFITFGYALFQTANNTAVMKDVPSDRRGAISGLLNLSRNLGLITGTSVMGALFALASGTSEITEASAEAVAGGMRITFAVAAGLILVALIIANVSRSISHLQRNLLVIREQKEA